MEKNESSGMSGLQFEGLMGLNCENSLTKVYLNLLCDPARFIP